MTAVSYEIRHAADILEAGGLVAFPTETVYGLGADAENSVAIAAIYALKGRPANHPLIVHLSPEGDVRYWAEDIPEEAFKLMAAFWPGPLTLILKRAVHIPSEVAGGQNSVGLRCPLHPVAQSLLRAFKAGKGGVAAPSANRFGHVSPTTAEHVHNEFGNDPRLGMVLDGGQSEVGIESTILDLSRMATHGAVMLRPGRITAEDIEAVIGHKPVTADVDAPRASGTLDAHYAPQTPIIIVAAAQIPACIEKLTQKGKRVTVMTHSFSLDENLDGVMDSIQLPSVPEGYAHDLYASLRMLDSMKADMILVEATPTDSGWNSVNDRLHRAAHDHIELLEKLLRKVQDFSN